jgi:TolB protein
MVAVTTIVALEGSPQQPQQPAPQPATQQPSDVQIAISSGGSGPPRIAVPDFAAGSPDAAEAARTIASVLFADLNFEREFYLIPRDTYSSVPRQTPGAPLPFASWQELGADAVVSGTVTKNGEDLRVDVRLFSVRNQQQVMALSYESRNPRLLAHTLSDEIHLKQRGLKGVARTKLAFVSDRDRERPDGTVERREVKHIYIADYDGANPRRVSANRNLNLNPSWSPDARTIAYTAYSASAADIVLSRIYDGLPLQRPAKGIGNNYLPAYSPDGTRIAFMSTRDGNGEIYVINADGTGLRRITNNPEDDATPTWSPSGQQIAFTSNRSGRPTIYIVNADGTGQPRAISTDPEADRPTWSPAPFNEIAFTAKTGTWYDIKVYDVASGTSRVLTDGRASNESPAFSPTGRHLAFTSTRTGSKQIFVIGRDGRGLTQITREGNNQTPSWSSN